MIVTYPGSTGPMDVIGGGMGIDMIGPETVAGGNDVVATGGPDTYVAGIDGGIDGAGGNAGGSETVAMIGRELGSGSSPYL